MTTDFYRILTLVRKEKGFTQKYAAEQLGISQALLSHYEKGIRECKLDFLIRSANFYGVSIDYLLGRSADKTGAMISVDQLSDGIDDDKANAENMAVIMHKKLIMNSLDVLFDYLVKAQNLTFSTRICEFLGISVYRMVRIVHRASPHNNDEMFSIPKPLVNGYANSALQKADAEAMAIADGECKTILEQIENPENLTLTIDGLNKEYPGMVAPFLNLIKNCEALMKK